MTDHHHGCPCCTCAHHRKVRRRRRTDRLLPQAKRIERRIEQERLLLDVHSEAALLHLRAIANIDGFTNSAAAITIVAAAISIMTAGDVQVISFCLAVFLFMLEVVFLLGRRTLERRVEEEHEMVGDHASAIVQLDQEIDTARLGDGR